MEKRSDSSEDKKEEKTIMRSLDKDSKKKTERTSGGFSKSTKLVSVLLILALGIGSGFLIAQLTIATGVVNKKVEVREIQEGEEVEVGTVVGADDKRQFPDEAEGTLVEGGIDGEGTHHLEREGGPSQYVYLTSSNVDLDKFVGRKVKIDGKTFDAQKAGWLMDVGQLEVLE